MADSLPMDETPFVLPVDNATLLIALAVLVPGAVTLLTKAQAPDWVKNIVNLFISALVSALNQVFDAGLDDFTWRAFAASTALTFAMSVLAYQKIWKDSPIHGWLSRASHSVGVNASPRTPVNTDSKVLTPVLVEDSSPVAVRSSQVPVVVAAAGNGHAASSSDSAPVVPQSFTAKAEQAIVSTGPAPAPGSHSPAPNPFENEG